jgi:hypothetical protein
MLRQAESIQKFLAPCEHLVIIEDKEFDKSFWIEHLSSYYTNHKLTLKSYNKFVSFKYNGWVRQQAFKLLAALECEDKYLILDSKDFFIRPNKLSDWDEYVGSNIIDNIGYFVKPQKDTDNWYLKLSLTYASYFKNDIVEEVFEPTTPFVIDTLYINRSKLHHDVNQFLNLYYVPSEFIFYLYMAPEMLKNFKTHKFKTCKLYVQQHFTDEQFSSIFNARLKEVIEDNNVIVFGVHRESVKRFTPDQLALVNNWIRSIGLVTEI